MRPNLALPDRLQRVEATKAGRLEVATAAADLVEVVVATEALRRPAVDDKSLSTMSVILTPSPLIVSELSVDMINIVAVHRWLARPEGLVPSSWYVPFPRTNATFCRSQGSN